jgi:hypothetical protein
MGIFGYYLIKLYKMTDEPVYYWTIDILEEDNWIMGTIRYATEYTARLAALSLNIDPDKIRLTKHQFIF